jgi:hypothetical protein
MAKTKTCSSCKEQKPTTQFSKNSNTKDLLQYNCKDCNKKINDSKNPVYYEENQKANKNGIIYTITNPLGEVYIGSTKRRPIVRFQMHDGTYKYDKIHGCPSYPKLHKSFDQWGFDAHDFKVISNLGNISKEELRNIEAKMIIALKNNGKSLNVNN